jgi:hypothetical protein
VLRADVGVLLRRGFLPSGSLKAIKGRSGYRNTAMDLIALVTVLEKSWDGSRAAGSLLLPGSRRAPRGAREGTCTSGSCSGGKRQRARR